MKWTESLEIRFHDADASGRVAPGTALRLMEEIGNNQIDVQHPTWDELAEHDQAFVINCLRIQFYKPILPHDRITVNTWACPSKGVFFNRCYQIARDGEVIAELNSIWAMVGLSDRKIYRVGEVELFYDTDEQLTLNKPTQTRIPTDVTLEKIGTHQVRYSETDYIGHMNNTRYLDLLCDHIPDFRSRMVTSIGIKFKAEAPLGEQLELYRAKVGDTYYFRTIRGDGQVNIEAEIETALIE